jgi:hypothetical protein
VNDDVKKIQRTVVFVKPDIVIFIDELEKDKTPSTFQARFQAFNADGKAALVIEDSNKKFEIGRPFSILSATVNCDTAFHITKGQLDVPEDKGIFPYVEVSTDASKKCTLVTVCALSPFPISQKSQVEKLPTVDILRTPNEYRIHFKTEKQAGTILVSMGKQHPSVQLER